MLFHRPSVTFQSSNLAIGVASAFIVLSAVFGLVAERDAAIGAPAMTWRLRGTIMPTEVVAPPALTTARHTPDRTG